MEIIREEMNRIVSFKDLEAGDIFRHNEDYYIKCEPNSYVSVDAIDFEGEYDDSDLVDAIRLSSGEGVGFFSVDKVERIRYRFVVED